VSLRTAAFRVPAGVTLPGEGALEIAVEVVAPAQPKPVVLVCLPGGAMTRRYWDLRAPGDDSFSFAREMAARGFISVLIDHLGVGESSRPADGYALDAFLLARANAHATEQVLARLRTGGAIDGLGAMHNVTSVGIGHSMGAMLTVLQQAEAHQHRGIAVLGFSTRGLPEYLVGEAKELAGDPVAARREAARLAREMFREDYPKIGRSTDGSQLYAGLHAEAAGIEAIKPARERLLPVPAFMSMLPGNVAPEAARIAVPVFVGLGELDIAGPPQDAPKAFTSSRAVEFALLPKTGHSHFLFAGRRELFDRLARWVDSLSS
jgi:pimeloyl-ACP methyl ester carboxylesterase